jgi:hypothetical protein
MENPFRDYVIPEYTWRRGILRFDDPQDVFTINNRGVMFTSSKWTLPRGFWEPWHLTGSQVKINGVEVKVRGVEAFASMRTPDFPYEHCIGILVSPEDAERIGWKK